MVANLYRGLRPGGRLAVLGRTAGLGPRSSDYTGEHHMPPEMLISRAAAAGFLMRIPAARVIRRRIERRNGTRRAILARLLRHFHEPRGIPVVPSRHGEQRYRLVQGTNSLQARHRCDSSVISPEAEGNRIAHTLDAAEERHEANSGEKSPFR